MGWISSSLILELSHQVETEPPVDAALNFHPRQLSGKSTIVDDIRSTGKYRSIESCIPHQSNQDCFSPKTKLEAIL